MNELSKLLELDKSSVTGLVDRAEAAGAGRPRPIAAGSGARCRSPSPRRAGRWLGEFAAGFEADVAEMLDGLSAAQRASLSRLLSRIVGHHAAGRGVDVSVEPVEVAWERR